MSCCSDFATLKNSHLPSKTVSLLHITSVMLKKGPFCESHVMATQSFMILRAPKFSEIKFERDGNSEEWRKVHTVAPLLHITSGGMLFLPEIHDRFSSKSKNEFEKIRASCGKASKISSLPDV